MKDDEWVKAAMEDDSMVVELLIRFNQSTAHAKRKTMVVPPIKWGVRQPRSRQILRCSTVEAKKEGESTRASPTTPLSWSGGTSFSGGGGTGDGYEESSRSAKRPYNRRSEVTATSKTANRRSRKKKSFAELKEEESLLLKEILHLKKETATLRITHKEHKARNESLKRIKLQLAKETGTKQSSSDQLHNTTVAPTDSIFMILPTSEPEAIVYPSSDSFEAQKKKATANHNGFLMLPDLNLLFEDDSGSEILYGMS